MASINDLAKPLIEISSIPGIETVVDVLNLDWEIKEVNEDGIDFKLKYKDPLEVSQNEEPDKVLVTLNLASFTDEYG